MGLLDLPAPLLGAVDDALSAGGLPPLARLVVWGGLSGIAAMGLYRMLSAQRRLADMKARIAVVRREIHAYDGEFAGLRPLLARSIALATRQVWLSLLPSLAAGIPVLVAVAWLGSAYPFDLPRPGEGVELRITPAEAAIDWRPSRPAALADGRLAWPDARVDLVDAEGTTLLSLPLEHAVPVVHKRAWWNRLWGNPAGYLPETGVVERIDIGLPREAYLDFGPSWLGRWETIYFASLLALSLAVKIAFRIQ